MEYRRIGEVSREWKISPRRLQTLCAAGKIPGAVRFGRDWMIPQGTAKPVDGRTKAAREWMTSSSFHVRLEVVQDDNGILSVKSAQLHKGTVHLEEVSGTQQSVTRYEKLDGGRIEFVNSYKAAPTQIVLSAKKTLTGRELQNEEFSFELLSQDGKVMETVKNDADGNIRFTAIPAEKAGESKYTIREVKGEELGITYDERAYSVTAVVTDLYDGTFKVDYKITVDGESAEEVLFENSYTAPSAPPQTGDGAPVALWMIMAIVSLAALFTLILAPKMKKQNAR